MSTIKISELDADAALGGSEMIPVSDAGTSKRTSPSQLSAYVVDQIEAIEAGVAVTGADGIYVLQGGALKPVDIDLVCQHAIDTIWGKAAETSPDNADVLALKDGGTTEKTVTLANLAEYVRATIQAAILDVSDLNDGSGALAAADYLLITQGAVGKRIAVSDLTALIYASLATEVAALDAVSATNDADVFYCIQSGTAKKVTLEDILDHAGSLVDGSGTAGLLAKWSDSNTLQAGESIISSTTGFTVGSDSAIPTTKAVRDEMDTIVSGATEKTTPVVDDDLLISDSEAASVPKKVSVGNMRKAVLNSQTGTSYTFVLADQFKYVRLTNGSAITLTVPPNASVAFPVGTEIRIIQGGAGQVTVTEGSGVTVNSSETLKLKQQYSAATLIKVDTNTWDLFGELEASP